LRHAMIFPDARCR